MQKRVAAIHDISCFGKCSLTVALPVISATGIECSVIPTAVLSTHTGGFSGYTFRDLTDDVLPVAEHWKKENLTFDAVYTGYLGSVEQIDIVCRAVNVFADKNTLLIVDPVMADHGKLYGGFSDDFPKEMCKLCSIADVITPNITEAAFMTDTPYLEPPYTEEYVNTLLLKLSKITKAKIVLTGVRFDNEKIGAACFENGNITYAFAEYVNASYHGTGDVFASTLVSAVIKGKTLNEAAIIAARYTAECIKVTNKKYPTVEYGVAFEESIPTLLKLLGIIKTVG